MASFSQLKSDVCRWLNRQDIIPAIPGWVLMLETELAETLRARCQVTFGTQLIDSPYITLPPNFATMESIRDADTGELLVLKDEWSGSWTEPWPPSPYSAYAQINPDSPCTAYRLTSDCIEFLPHPVIPADTTGWTPQKVLMGYYQKPTPSLVNDADSNAILEAHYGVYLWGVIKYGALYELDQGRAAQADAEWQQQVTRANLWKQQSDYSGAPFRAEAAVSF